MRVQTKTYQRGIDLSILYLVSINTTVKICLLGRFTKVFDKINVKQYLLWGSV